MTEFAYSEVAGPKPVITDTQEWEWKISISPEKSTGFFADPEGR